MKLWLQAHHFCQDFINDLHQRSIPALILGGNACSFYRLPHFQKDLDLLIPPAKASVIISPISGLSFLGSTAKMLPTAGAPLAENWLRGGWTSHIYFGDSPQKQTVRLDFFGGALRTSNPVAGRNPHYLSRNDLANTKKTQRGHDWDYVNFLGLQMLMRGDLRGILHVTNLEILQRIGGQIPIPAEFLAERPLLKLAQSDPQELERHLLGERIYWQKLDALRQEKYLAAWVPYGAEIQKHPELKDMSFQEQNLALIILAICTLDPEPIKTKDWTELVNQSRDFAVSMIRQLDPTTLPIPAQFHGCLQNQICQSTTSSGQTYQTRPLVRNHEYQEILEWCLGPVLAELCNYPYPKLLDEIHDFQGTFDSPRDQAWPTEYHAGPELP